MKVIRGAVCAENTAESIRSNAIELIKEIIERNALSEKDVECIFFSATTDLTAYNPATAVRTSLLPNCSYMCFSEMSVEGAMPKVIRAAVFVNLDLIPEHCYLGKTSELRKN